MIISQSHHEFHLAGPIESHESASPGIVYLEASVVDHVVKLSVVSAFIHHLASCSNDGVEVFSVGFVVFPLLVNRVFR